MPKRQLTDRFCASAKARDGELQTDYFDTQVSGLALRVSKWGHKAWTLHYTLGGKRRRLTLGAYSQHTHLRRLIAVSATATITKIRRTAPTSLTCAPDLPNAPALRPTLSRSRV
jgi:hypothetical protein